MGAAKARTRRWFGARRMAVAVATVATAVALAVSGTPAVATAAATDDFSILVAPSTSEVGPFQTIDVSVMTSTVVGLPQAVALSATGYPADILVYFPRPSITSGNTATMVVATSAAISPGRYPITVLGTGQSATHSATYTLVVRASSTCAATNDSDVTIVDMSTVESTVALTGCTGNASAASTVEVHIVHTYRGDLVVSLIAPDGTPYFLSNRQGGGGDNIDQTYTLDLSSESRNGTWRLRVQDAAASDTGFVNSWNLHLGSTPAVCTATNGSDVTIVDQSTVESTVALTGCTGNASATSTVEVQIVHTYRGDLFVSLIAPDGTPYFLSNRQGGGADNIDQTYTLDLSSETRNGTWRLRVQDAAMGDTGFINGWSLTL
jgi:subtilisin-like proprotein convertase family protein